MSEPSTGTGSNTPVVIPALPSAETDASILLHRISDLQNQATGNINPMVRSATASNATGSSLATLLDQDHQFEQPDSLSGTDHNLLLYGLERLPSLLSHREAHDQRNYVPFLEPHAFRL